MVAMFWSSVFLVFYAYFGYPLALYALSKRCSRPVKRDETYTPRVTLITAVHNEAGRIEKKINNILSLHYPCEKLEVIFASDASTDGTDEIVQRFGNQGIRLVRSSHRGGKEFAQKCAIAQASTDIIVFSDVATMMEPDGIRKIVSNFADAIVGCVSSEDKFMDEQGRVSGEGAYVRYEMWLRSLETRVNSVVGLSGSFFAARRDVCRNWPTNIPSDFNTLLNNIKSGYRGISDPESVGVYTNIKDEKKEFERKVRTITRGISALMANCEFLNPIRYGMFAWQLGSHKLMRWLVPWFMVLAMGLHIALALRRGLYRLLLASHLGFYILALLGSCMAEQSIIFKIPYYFVQVNRAIAVAWIKYVKGERFVTWTPSKR